MPLGHLGTYRFEAALTRNPAAAQEMVRSGDDDDSAPSLLPTDGGKFIGDSRRIPPTPRFTMLRSARDIAAFKILRRKRHLILDEEW